MLIDELITVYKLERKQAPKTMNDLLDLFQKKYITGEIDINYYRKIYYFLNEEGATSAYEFI
ncbi:YppF family protein [Virgibacillus sp. C22-A2]|uniref:YppF family protein n=1 Tax=Virgibacillus tibetensis TaxID=3042313 RepID=A0ABU6KEW7_9BACI|nr:YppF family protein [Virgibacillus sp. C22-A2]